MSDIGSAGGLVLSTGARIPRLGLGVWQVPDGARCERAVRWALEAGYRLIDTAQAYGNETSVGRAIRDSGVPREEIFLTTKFYPGRRNPLREAEASLRRLGTDHVDLYLVHWPQGGPTRAWPGMEAAQREGLARAIGVSNFDPADLAALKAVAQVPPAVNQVQLSPFEYRRELIDACAADGIVVQSYSPLGTGRHLSDRTVGAVAARCGRSPAQVLIRWAIQKGLSVLPKSVHRERIVDNAAVFDFALDDASMAELDALDRTGTTSEALAAERKWWH
ncbi:aldo/keto reductase [Actinocatenispora rupis]|uniref:Glyoxal reductase n=1 Tax=Actinocatenispora rupis TaxID=519421 RepID=A0A8J3JHL3_9ACTN|nr:aldo/keto reductase [Actinocatenispora rupis]GID16018.1 glyoxal reductase [Actinocatenispora rupis]